MNDILDTPPSDLLPMREVVRLTGVNPVTLRAWERRYGLVSPLRTEGGHRLYTPQDLQTIQDILLWSGRGMAVGKIGELLAQRQRPQPARSDDEREHWREAFSRATAAFDQGELERLYGQAYSIFPGATLLDDILLPLWRSLLTLNAFGARSQWGFLDAFLRARVLLRLQMSRAEGAAVLLADASGTLHELELLAAALLLGGDDLRVQALAPGMPLDELPLVCAGVRPAALVLLAEVALPGEALRRLERLQMAVECPLALLGEAAQGIAGSAAGLPIVALGNSPASSAQPLRLLLRGALQL
ncbi:DNA-binding transcriptional MerR regulator [Pseudomonas nitritireducens]|uniref:DNA-binding transcriptional MerR regulator n=1 Tax=Pseudomonas nitroreducens TaxID=46680 RepID=A0A7W7KGR3_PSENT|nr:MerR family transcriptional regulator [Pseudomonas nitritireducens]MBB4862156.1 DNA-binding transcriptional MerR regulator [Pseudomonas nitritireducens]